jgi:hypothetical protein
MAILQFYFFLMLGFKLKASCLQHKCSNTEPHPNFC